MILSFGWRQWKPPKLVGSFPCQLGQISLTASLFGMGSGNRQPLGISALCGRLLTAIPVYPLDVVVRTLVSRIPWVHLYLSQQIGVRSSKTSQCGSANRPSVVPQGSPRIWCLSKSLLVSQTAVSVCRHDLPACTTKWVTLLWVTKRWLEASPWSLYFPHWLGHCTQGPTWPLHAW